jgi:two-component system OmpR family response regulator
MPATLRKILYVEDEQDIRTVATMALEMVGKFTVRACGSGEEAIAALSGFAPDLILLDVMMPGMDGPTTLSRLREQAAGANAPAIFMTAKVQPNEIANLKGLGAVEVIAKPFDPMTLSETIRGIWLSAILTRTDP